MSNKHRIRLHLVFKLSRIDGDFAPTLTLNRHHDTVGPTSFSRRSVVILVSDGN